MIFSFSARPAEISSEDSRYAGLLIGELFVPGFENWTAEEQNAFAEKVDYPVRKTAHAAEYAALGLLAAGAYIKGGKAARTERTGIGRGILVPWVIATAYAAADELHQLLVPGRSGQFSDVILDSSGALAGLAVLGVVRFLIQRRRRA